MKETPLKMLALHCISELIIWGDKQEHYLQFIPKESVIMNLMRLMKLELKV